MVAISILSRMAIGAIGICALILANTIIGLGRHKQFKLQHRVELIIIGSVMSAMSIASFVLLIYFWRVF